jgi:hypothetical protein
MREQQRICRDHDNDRATSSESGPVAVDESMPMLVEIAAKLATLWLCI